MENDTSTTDTQANESMDEVQAGLQQEGTSEGESMNWEKEAKKFQSMYDKAVTEGKHLSSASSFCIRLISSSLPFSTS